MEPKYMWRKLTGDFPASYRSHEGYGYCVNSKDDLDIGFLTKADALVHLAWLREELEDVLLFTDFDQPLELIEVY